MTDDRSDRSRSTPREYHARWGATARNSTRDELRRVGLLASISLLLIAAVGYSTDLGGILTTVVLLALAAILFVISFPRYAFREDDNQVAVYNESDDHIRTQLRIGPRTRDRADWTVYEIDLAPDERTVVTASFERAEPYVISMTVAGRELRTELVPNLSIRSDNETNPVYCLEITADAICTRQYASGHEPK